MPKRRHPMRPLDWLTLAVAFTAIILVAMP